VIFFVGLYKWSPETTIINGEEFENP